MENIAGLPPKTKKEEAETKAVESKSGFTFPREFSNIVYIRRRKFSGGVKIEGEIEDESIARIGSSFRGNTVLRGLTFEEETRWLPTIIGISPDSDKWETKTREYWENIRRDVPPLGKDGTGGLELQIGLRYKTEEDYLADKNAKRNSNGAIDNPKGEPINLGDYILWKYCLDYSRVANTIEDLNKSPKIEFYIFSKQREIETKKTALDIRKKAKQLLYSNLSDREWVEHLLRLLSSTDKETKHSIRDIINMIPDEQDILLESYSDKYPETFYVLGSDKNLRMKSNIETWIAAEVLRRIPNTTTVSFDGDIIGNSLEEVVMFLNNPKNGEILKSIKAQGDAKPLG